MHGSVQLHPKKAHFFIELWKKRVCMLCDWAFVPPFKHINLVLWQHVVLCKSYAAENAPYYGCVLCVI